MSLKIAIMSKAAPLVTAVVTTHNRPDLLPRALNSVAVQTYPNLELVVVDDGSEEDVSAIVENYRDTVQQFRYVRNNVPQGACAARNKGIEVAKGVFIAGLDDDDQWLQKRVERLMEAHEDKYAFVTSDVRLIYKKGSPVWHKKRVITLDDLLYSNYVGNQGLIKKVRLEAVGGFDEELEAAQDYDLWIRLAEKYGPVKNVQEPLQEIYLEHEGDRISTPQNQLKGYLQFYKKHKAKMDRVQRKYQLYNIRKATGKISTAGDIMGWVPPHRYWKEMKGWVADTYFSGSDED